MPTTMFYYLYILQSLKDSSFYIGVTNNPKRRLAEHNRGFSRSTAPKTPYKLVKIEKYLSKSKAYQREKFIKNKKNRKIVEKIILSDI